ncbi:hypothetical protein QYF36_003609 [Acer negundo]|nr:hypothetical protein QYF36_003609 [Acer negundo]
MMESCLKWALRDLFQITSIAIEVVSINIAYFQHHFSTSTTISRIDMDRGEFDYKRKSGSVKAAINMYGDRIYDGSDAHNNSKMDLPESSSRARKLHRARKDISRYKESRRTAELAKLQAESELSNARNKVKDLASLIEESNTKVKAKMSDIETLQSSGKHEEKMKMAAWSGQSLQYSEVMQELEFVKRELSKLKLDMASVLEEKLRAEKEVETLKLKIGSNSSNVEALRKEIDETNEELVLVELARIEALKEYAEIEAQREKEASEFSFAVERKKEKIKETSEEIDRAKELENKLAVTLSDVNVLKNELKNVKEMHKSVQSNDSFKHTQVDFHSVDELEGSPLLQPITEELEAAKVELASIKEEGFQFMASMDVIRNELKHVREETARFRKAEEKSDLIVQSLNSKLLRAKSKLEAATAAEEKATEIASNLSLTLEQLKTEAEAAKKEKELVVEETATIKAEIQKTETEIDSTEEKLQAAMQELNAIKSSEALALENLKSLIENTMQTRASASQHSSLITISKFEYEYLTGRAGGAEEIADKKVAASQAWIEALKASEKEILMRIELAHKEIRETGVDEEKETFRTQRSLSTKRNVEGELRKWRHKREKNTEEAENMRPGPTRKYTRGSIGNLTPSRRAKFQKSASPSTRMARSSSIAIKKKTKVVPNFVKLFSGKSIDDDNNNNNP